MNIMTKVKLSWGDNESGRIICAETRAQGMAPVRRGHPECRRTYQAGWHQMVQLAA